MSKVSQLPIINTATDNTSVLVVDNKVAKRIRYSDLEEQIAGGKAKGDTGPTGPSGPQGPQGQQGIKGIDGAKIISAIGTTTGTPFSITFTLSDNSSFTVNVTNP